MLSLHPDKAREVRNSVISALCRSLAALFPARETPHPSTVRAAAIIKFCCLGDVLMSTPTVAALRAAYPAARLDFFVGTWAKPAIEGNPHLDNIVDCGEVSARRIGLASYWELVRRLRQGCYDVCFVLERSAFVTLLPLLAGVRYRIGLDSKGRGFPLTSRVACDQVRHEVEQYLAVARAIGATLKQPRLEFYVSPSEVARATAFLTEIGQREVRANAEFETADDAAMHRRPLVAIHPGGGANPGMALLAKRWSPARFAAIADRLAEEYGARVLVVGAASDIPVAREMRAEMRSMAIDLAGRFGIRELGAILARCDLFVGNDSGPTHLAVAVGTPVVAIFGPTDERVYGPYSPDSVAVASVMPCRPCFKDGSMPSCRSMQCIAAVTVEQVWRAVEDRLAVRGFARLR